MLRGRRGMTREGGGRQEAYLPAPKETLTFRTMHTRPASSARPASSSLQETTCRRRPSTTVPLSRPTFPQSGLASDSSRSRAPLQRLDFSLILVAYFLAVPPRFCCTAQSSLHDNASDIVKSSSLKHGSTLLGANIVVPINAGLQLSAQSPRAHSPPLDGASGTQNSATRPFLLTLAGSHSETSCRRLPRLHAVHSERPRPLHCMHPKPPAAETSARRRPRLHAHR